MTTPSWWHGGVQTSASWGWTGCWSPRGPSGRSCPSRRPEPSRRKRLQKCSTDLLQSAETGGEDVCRHKDCRLTQHSYTIILLSLSEWLRPTSKILPRGPTVHHKTTRHIISYRYSSHKTRNSVIISLHAEGKWRWIFVVHTTFLELHRKTGCNCDLGFRGFRDLDHTRWAVWSHFIYTYF